MSAEEEGAATPSKSNTDKDSQNKSIMDPRNFWYLKLREWGDRGDKKKPAESFGGHSIEYEENDKIYSYDEIKEQNHSRYGIVGYRGASNLVIIDLDAYKIDEFDPDDILIPDEKVGVVKSEKEGRDVPGFHFYVLVDEYKDLVGSERYIDIKANQKGHAVAPWSTDDYSIVNNPDLFQFTEVDDINDEFSLNGENIITVGDNSTEKQYKNDESQRISRTHGADSISLASTKPKTDPHCIRELENIRVNPEKRKKFGPDNNPWKLDTYYAQLLAVNGYSLNEIVDKFRQYPKNGRLTDFDEQETADQSQRIIRKMESGDLWPPVTKLCEAGIDISHCNCRAHSNDQQHYIPIKGHSGQLGKSPGSDLTIDDIRDTLGDVLENAIKQNTNVVVNATPGAGKTYTWPEKAAGLEEPTVVATGRGRKEMYEEYEKRADNLGLTNERLPTIQDDCGTANGSFGEGWVNRINNLRKRGLTAKEMHQYMDLPCMHDGKCDYQKQWQSDALNEADMLIGHYSHLNVPKSSNGRTVIVDEYPSDAFKIELGKSEVTQAINALCSSNPDSELDNYNDVTDSNPDAFDVLELFKNTDPEPQPKRDPELAIPQNGGGHALAPVIAWTILNGTQLETDIKRYETDEMICIWDQKYHEFYALQPPKMYGNNGIVGLDGTPVEVLWDMVFNEDFEIEDVMKEIRAEFIQNVQNITIVETSKYIHFQGGADPERIQNLIDAISEVNDVTPGVICPQSVEDKIDHPEKMTKHFGNLLSSSTFSDCHVGIVTNATHFGDDFMRLWCAFAGEDFVREGKGATLDYGEFGNKLYSYMHEYQVLQAILRFGRDQQPTIVYADTTAIPDDINTLEFGAIDGNKIEVIRAMQEFGQKKGTSLIAEQVNVSENQTRRILTELHEEGLVHREELHTGSYIWMLQDGINYTSVTGI